MKNLLITGFEPFGGERVNPAWEAVSRLPERIGDYEVYPRLIPTVFGAAFDAVQEHVRETDPDCILCIGQAGGRAQITPEWMGINLRSARIADNAGKMPLDESIIENAPAAYFATVPVRRMADAIREAGLPSAISYSAGTFVCNDVLYALLHHYAQSQVRIGFVHVPFLPEQAKDGQPSLTLDQIIAGLTAAIEAL